MGLSTIAEVTLTEVRVPLKGGRLLVVTIPPTSEGEQLISRLYSRETYGELFSLLLEGLEKGFISAQIFPILDSSISLNPPWMKHGNGLEE
jgi:hypothetical protein